MSNELICKYIHWCTPTMNECLDIIKYVKNIQIYKNIFRNAIFYIKIKSMFFPLVWVCQPELEDEGEMWISLVFGCRHSLRKPGVADYLPQACGMIVIRWGAHHPCSQEVAGNLLPRCGVIVGWGSAGSPLLLVLLRWSLKSSGAGSLIQQASLLWGRLCIRLPGNPIPNRSCPSGIC